MKLFNPAVFNSAVFNTGGSAPQPTHGSRRRPPRIAVDIDDAAEAALIIAFLRHRFHI